MLGIDDIENSDNNLLRRLSTRRGTLSALASRRDSYFDGEQRRMSVRADYERRMSQIDPVS